MQRASEREGAAIVRPAVGGNRLAYVSRLVYPDQTANALQTIHMAAALATELGQGSLFVHDLMVDAADVRRAYATPDAPLRIVPLRTSRWPRPIYNNGWLRFGLYNSSVAASLGLDPAWHSARHGQNVLFVRSRLEILYWGQLRPYLPWLRQWQFVCEVHDLQLPPGPNEDRRYDDRSPRATRFERALSAYDHVLAVTQGLAEDIEAVTHGTVAPKVMPLSSGLERLSRPPVLALASPTIVLGYVGTLDLRHGIQDCLLAMQRLPETFTLRLVGRAEDESGLRQWVAERGLTQRVEIRPPVPYRAVARELGEIDIVLAPAGHNIHSYRHRSPLKVFDYMARGKPIVAADVPCHREILREGVTAELYRCGEAADLAAKIQRLAECPAQATALARAAWLEAASHTYTGRAKQIHALLEHSPRQPRRSPN